MTAAAGATAVLAGGCTPEPKLTPAMVLKSLGITEGPALVYYTSDGCTTHDNKNLTIISEKLAPELKNEKPFAIDILGFTNFDWQRREPKGTRREIEKRIGRPPGSQYADLITHSNHARTAISAGADVDTVIRDARTLSIRVNPNDLRNHPGRVLLFDANLNLIGSRLSQDDPNETVDQFRQALERSRTTPTRER